jgi:hypothetical protein
MLGGRNDRPCNQQPPPPSLEQRIAAALRQSNQGSRVSSRSLGRNLEEDISFTCDGMVDFGVADMGDSNLGKRTGANFAAPPRSRIISCYPKSLTMELNFLAGSATYNNYTVETWRSSERKIVQFGLENPVHAQPHRC